MKNDTHFIKLTQELEETFATNNIKEDVANVIRISVQMAYLLGNKRGLKEGNEICINAINPDPEGINIGHELAGGLTEPTF